MLAATLLGCLTGVSGGAELGLELAAAQSEH
jgi:hypothetical protein